MGWFGGLEGGGKVIRKVGGGGTLGVRRVTSERVVALWAQAESAR